ncbi:MAG: helix-turn-helix transcriptional regulator [Acidobacteriota bacterium]
MAKDICVQLGERIREVRKARQWRQIDLAAHSGVNIIYISDLENGRKEICLKTLQAVASAFDMTITELLAPTGL